ncbi:MAG: DUF3307 domain-containing protein [Anaerolineae bacterium]|jgi:hypothetical protein
MSLFDWLLVGHLVGDFLLQTDGMARNKSKSWPWMLRHVGLYMLLVTVVIVVYALSHPLSFWWIALALLLLSVTHVGLDRRRFTTWWMGVVGIEPQHPWLGIVVDQVFHILILAIVAQGLVMVSG